MHTVELLEQSLDLAKQLGYLVRQEWLDGNGGGACELKGRKVLFLDLALGPIDQLELVLDALRREPDLADPNLADVPMSPPLRELLHSRKSA